MMRTSLILSVLLGLGLGQAQQEPTDAEELIAVPDAVEEAVIEEIPEAEIEAAEEDIMEGVIERVENLSNTQFISESLLWHNMMLYMGFQFKDGIYSRGEDRLTLDPSGDSVYWNGLRIMLTKRMKRDEMGQLLISRRDMERLIKPLLQPAQSAIECIILDAPFGGYEQGLSMGEHTEASSALNLVKNLASRLRARGIKVILTREEDYFISLQRRCDFVNQHSNALYLSLRYEPSDKVTCYISDDEAQLAPQLGYALQSQIIAASQGRDGALRQSDYNYLQSIKHTAAIIFIPAVDKLGVSYETQRAQWQEKLDAIDEQKGKSKRQKEKEKQEWQETKPTPPPPYKNRVMQGLEDAVLLFIEKTEPVDAVEPVESTESAEQPSEQ